MLDEQWVPVDPTWHEVDIHATHIRLKDDGAIITALGQTIELDCMRVESKIAKAR